MLHFAEVDFGFVRLVSLDFACIWNCEALEPGTCIGFVRLSSLDFGTGTVRLSSLELRGGWPN